MTRETDYITYALELDDLLCQAARDGIDDIDDLDRPLLRRATCLLLLEQIASGHDDHATDYIINHDHLQAFARPFLIWATDMSDQIELMRAACALTVGLADYCRPQLQERIDTIRECIDREAKINAADWWLEYRKEEGRLVRNGSPVINEGG